MEQEGQGGSNGQESLEVKLSRKMGATLELRKGIMIEERTLPGMK